MVTLPGNDRPSSSRFEFLVDNPRQQNDNEQIQVVNSPATIPISISNMNNSEQNSTMIPSSSGSNSNSSSIPIASASNFSSTASQSSNFSSTSNGISSSSTNRTTSTGLKADFLKLADKNTPIAGSPMSRSNFRPSKRPSNISNCGNVDDIEPPPQSKIRITEEKMLARLRNFHITSAANNIDSNWFFMQKPVEMFDDIENRMSDEDEDEEVHQRQKRILSPSTKSFVSSNADYADFSDDNSTEQQQQHISSSTNTLAVSGVLKRLLEADRKRAATVIPSVGSPCTDLVLWKSPSEIFKELMPEEESTISSNSTTNKSPIDFASGVVDGTPMSSTSGLFGQASTSWPSSTSMDSDYESGGNNHSESAIYQRRNARQYSKPIIDVLNLPTACVTPPNSETNSSTETCMMDIDD